MNSPRKPSVLFVFYTHTEQSRRVADAMAGVLRERGCDVWMAGIEFTDPRYAGQIRVPDVAREGDYDLVCLGSPTWFFTTNMPLRSYLKSAEAGKVLAGKRFAAYVVCRRYWSINLKEVRKLGTAQGGAYADGTRFQFAGGQIRSLLSLISYFGQGEMRERYLGVKIPPTNLKPDFLGQAQVFANRLADGLGSGHTTPDEVSPTSGPVPRSTTPQG